MSDNQSTNDNQNADGSELLRPSCCRYDAGDVAKIDGDIIRIRKIWTDKWGGLRASYSTIDGKWHGNVTMEHLVKTGEKLENHK